MYYCFYILKLYNSIIYYIRIRVRTPKTPANTICNAPNVNPSQQKKNKAHEKTPTSSEPLNICNILKPTPTFFPRSPCHTQRALLHVFIQPPTPICCWGSARCWSRPPSHRPANRQMIVFSRWRSERPARL